MRLPLISAALLGASLLALPAPASAAQFAGFSNSLPVQAQSFDSSLVQQVRSGRNNRNNRNNRSNRSNRSNRGGRGGGGNNAGAIAAGSIFGLAIGAIIGSQASQYNRSVEWCTSRYRSYNPRTGTWVDYHGRIHHCP